MKGINILAAALVVVGANAATLGRRTQEVDCKTDLTGDSIHAPYLIIPVNETDPDVAEGTSYFGQVSETVSTVFSFGIPSGLDGRVCSLVFGFPRREQVNEGSYTFKGDGKVKVNLVEGPVTTDLTYNNKPTTTPLDELVLSPGETTGIVAFACPENEQTLSVELESAGSTELRYFQVRGKNSFGLYITACPASEFSNQ